MKPSNPFISASDEEYDSDNHESEEDEKVGQSATMEVDLTPRFDIFREPQTKESMASIVQDFRSGNRKLEEDNLRTIRQDIDANGLVNADSFIEAYYNLRERSEMLFSMNPELKPSKEQAAQTFKEWDIMRFVYAYAIGDVEGLELGIRATREEMLNQFVASEVDSGISYFRAARKKEKTERKKAKRRRSDAFIRAKRGREPEPEPEREELPTLTMKDAEEAKNMSDLLLLTAVLAASGGKGVSNIRMTSEGSFDMDIAAKPLRQRRGQRQESPVPTIFQQPEEEEEEEPDFSGFGDEEEEPDFAGFGTPMLTGESASLLRRYSQGERFSFKDEEEVLGIIADISSDRLEIPSGPDFATQSQWYKDALTRSVKERKPSHLKTGPLVTSADEKPEPNASYNRVYGFISGLMERGMSFFGRAITDVSQKDAKPQTVFERKYDTPEEGRKAQKQYGKQVEEVMLADAEAGKQIEAKRATMTEEEYVFAQIGRAGRVISAVSSVAGLGTLAYKAFTVNDVTQRAAEVESRLGRAEQKVEEMKQYIDHLEKEGGTLGMFASIGTQQDFINSLDNGGRIKYAQKVAEVARNEMRRIAQELEDPNIQQYVRAGWLELRDNISNFLQQQERNLARIQEGGDDGAEAATIVLGRAASIFGGRQGTAKEVAGFMRMNLQQVQNLLGGAMQKFDQFKRYAREDSFVAGLEDWAQDFFLWPIGGIVGSMINRLYSQVEVAIRAVGSAATDWSNAFSIFGATGQWLGGKLGAGSSIAFSAAGRIRPETIFELITVGTSVISAILTGNIVGVATALLTTRAARAIGGGIYETIRRAASAMDRRYYNGRPVFRDAIGSALNIAKIGFQVYVSVLAVINIYQILIGWFFTQFAIFGGIYAGSSILFFMFMTSVYNPGRLAYYLFQYFRKNKHALISTIFATYAIVLTVNFWLPDQKPLTIDPSDFSYIDSAEEVTSEAFQEGIARLDDITDQLIDKKLPGMEFVPIETSSIADAAIQEGGAATAAWLGVI